MLIAKRLGVMRQTVINLLERPDWRDVREEWECEVGAATDAAERTVRACIKQKKDLRVAAETARWYLAKIKREKFGEKVEHTGTVKTESTNKNFNVNVSTSIPLDQIKGISIEVKRQILAALDEEEAMRQAEQLSKGGTPLTLYTLPVLEQAPN